MTRQASELRKSAEPKTTSSQSANRPRSEEETQVSVPAYLGEQRDTTTQTPNYSQLESQQSGYEDLLCNEIGQQTEDQVFSSSPAVVNEAPQSEEDADDNSDAAVSSDEEEQAEEEQTEETQESEELEDAADAESEEAETDEEQGGSTSDESESDEQEEQDPSAPETAGQSTNRRFGTRGRAAAPASQAHQIPIPTPRVPSPPTAALLRREEIIKRTGSPPEQHHAMVLQGVQRTTQAARDAQRRMIPRVGKIAMQTRVSIEDMAEEVLAVAHVAIGHINDAVDRAMSDIEQAATAEMLHINTHGVLTGEALQSGRDKITLEITSELAQGSEAIQQANTLAEQRFDEKLPIAERSIMQIPETGAGQPLPNPPAPEGSSASGENDQVEATESTPETTAPYQVIDHATARLSEFLDTQADLRAENYANLKRYLLSRATPVLTGFAERQQTQLVENAQQRAEQTGSDANKARFTTMVLSLTTPVSEHHQEDQSASVDQADSAGDTQLTEAEAATQRANNTIRSKKSLAVEYANRDLRDNLTGNIRKSGRKAYKGLRDQAGSAETALNDSAAQMAVAYRDLVERLEALLPEDRFLESKTLLPKLKAARDSALQLQLQHEAAAEQQSAVTLEQLEKVKKDQSKSISKAGRKSAESVRDVVTRTQFDMSMFASQMTGAVSDGARQGIEAAREYAERMAEGILDSVEKMDGKALLQIDRIAVGFLNGAISSAEQGQYMALENFVTEMEKIGDKGQLTKPMIDSVADLEGRADAIDNAIPGQSLATAGGLALLSPIAAGVYLYFTDADEDVVIEKLGNLMWPGVLGLEDSFRIKGYGSLRSRIRAEMTDPEETHALNLFSQSAAVRGLARLAIANYSTGWFDYNRQARESALQGMSAAEQQALNALNPRLIEFTRQEMLGELDRHQGAIASAYLDRNRERAVAARTRESLDEAREQGEWGWIFSAQSAKRRSDEARVEVMTNMQGVLQRELAVEHAYVPRETLEASTQRVYGEFASLTDRRRRSADQFSDSTAQRAMIRYATSSHLSAVQGLGRVNIERVQMSKEASQYITDLVTEGADSDAARESRGVYEFRRAQGDSTLGLFDDLSETSQTRLSDAFENRRLADLERQVAEARNPQERSRAQRLLNEERGKHRERLQRMAARLGAPQEISDDPARAEQWMANQVGELFAREDDLLGTRPSHARYGEEMITRGRASLVAGVALASEGAGTHEDLLRRSYGDRSQREIQAANAQWALENAGENMEEMLGIRERSWDASDYALFAASPGAWFAMRGSETSGDLAMELQRLALGNRETDLDHVTYAGLHYNQERVRGTGFIAERSMQGTPEQRSLDGRRARLARTLLEAARDPDNPAANPDAVARFSDNPGALFRPDGSIDPAIQAAAFDNGTFRGDSSRLQHHTQSVSLAANSYRSEIDRQEAMLTTGITVLALVASVALMLIPGVNVVAAGVISAVIAGAATIAVKAGMRGERYGWEEAATDITSTAIEAATAGFGGAIAGGLGRAGGLAKVGAALTNRLGNTGSAIVREALVSAISSGAQVALQDEVWKDGLERGLERVLNGSLKGAAVAAVTAGVSEGLTNKLNTSMSPGEIDPANFRHMQNLGRALGPNGSEIFRESVSELLGSVAGETVGVLTDYATGKFKGKFGDALKQIGQAGLRDMASGAMRSSVMGLNRSRYRNLLEAARSGETLSPSDRRALRLAAISAGSMHYDDAPDKVRTEIDQGRELLSRLPLGLRQQAAGFDLNTLHDMHTMLEAGDLGSSKDRARFLRDLGESVPGLDGRALMRELDAAIIHRHPEDTAQAPDPAQQTRLRQQLSAGMDSSLRSVMDEVRLDGLEHLAPDDLRLASEMIARGRFNSQTADTLVRQARLENPELNEYLLLRNLHSAVETSRQAQQLKRLASEQRHQEVMAAVPEAGRKLFSDLPEESIAQVKQLLEQESKGSPHLQDALFREMQRNNPDLERQRFQSLLEAAVIQAKAQHDLTRHQARLERQQRMSNVPEELRSTLSLLPDAALVDLHLRQMEGSISPAERLKLQEAALREDPDLDLPAFHEALDAAIEKGAPIRPSAQEALQMRNELLSSIPETQRTLLADVPILVMPDADFAAYTRSVTGNAVTLIVNGQPVVMLREGANPRVLREEGLHALQSKDPRWAEHIGSLDEQQLGHWDDLPLDMQMALYRNKLELEIDAHDRMVGKLANELLRSSDPEQTARLRSELKLAQSTLSNLEQRMAEVAGIGPVQRLAIDAGMLPRPQWLDQPARLFSKLNAEEIASRKRELLDTITGDIKTEGSEYRDIRRRINKLDLDQLNELRELGLSPNDMRKVLKSNKAPADTEVLIGHLSEISSRLPESESAALLNQLIGKRDLNQLAPQLNNIARQAPDLSSAQQLLSAIINLSGNHLDAADNVSRYLAQVDSDHRRELVELINNIGSEGQGSLIQLLGEMHGTLRTLGADANDTQAVIAGMIHAAGSGAVSQRIDLINRAYSLLTALHQLADSAPRRAVTEHILNGLKGATDTQAHALDLRAASRLLVDGKIPPHVLASFHQSLESGSRFLAGGNAYQLHLADKQAAWKDFRQTHAEFAGLLDSTLGHLPEAQRAALADLEPWFSRIVASEWFQDRVRRSGNTNAEERAIFLNEIIQAGLRGRAEVSSFDSLRHILSEARQIAVGTTPEPEFNALVRSEMERMGISQDVLDKRHSDAGFQELLQRSRSRGEEVPEVHLENLIRQRIEYERMVDMAKEIAQNRHPDDAAARRRLENELTAGLKQKITETIGEIAASSAMLTDPRFEGFVLRQGFEAGTGFDQVWVRYGPDGEISEIMIVEAKGPGAAIAQTQTKGRQMTAEWVAKTAGQMILRGDRTGVGTMILDSIETGRPVISGLVVQANRDSSPGSITAAPGTDPVNRQYPMTELGHVLRTGTPLQPPVGMTGMGESRIADTQAQRLYEEIRTNTGDVETIARNLNLPVSVIERIKHHLFLKEHEIPTATGLIRERFEPVREFAEAWRAAEAGTLTSDQRKLLENLITHENVEASLSERGIPVYDPHLRFDETGYPLHEFGDPGAHSKAVIAERAFQKRLVDQMSSQQRQSLLRPMMEAALETRGRFTPEELNAMHPQARDLYLTLMKERGQSA